MATSTSGYLEIIIGPMFSGKTEELINRVKKTVSEKMGVNLELEIKIIGE